MNFKNIPEQLADLSDNQTLDIQGSKLAFFHRYTEIDKVKSKGKYTLYHLCDSGRENHALY